MDLYVLRHGKAGEFSEGQDDSLRKITGSGRKEIKGIARWMREEKFPLEIIATSPLVRAGETAEIIARTLHLKDQPVVWDDLAPGGDLDTVCYHAAQFGNNTAILVVGHEPGLSALIGRITSRDGTASLILSKGGLAKIKNFSFDQQPSGDLQWLLTSKQILAMR